MLSDFSLQKFINMFSVIFCGEEKRVGDTFVPQLALDNWKQVRGWPEAVAVREGISSGKRGGCRGCRGRERRRKREGGCWVEGWGCR